MRSRVDVKKLLYALPDSRTLRELARKAQISHTAVRRIVKELSTQGRFRIVTDDSFYGLTRLIAFADSGKIPERIPFATTGLRTLISSEGTYTLAMAYLPEKLVGNYIENLKDEVEVKEWFYSKDYVSWLPNPELEVLAPKDFEKLIDRSAEYIPPRAKTKPLEIPDMIDLILLWGKQLFGPFARPSEIFSRLGENLKMPSKQILSYHYRAHFQPGWRYTTYFKYASSDEVPFIMYYLKGPDTEKVARALALLPGNGMSIIGDRQALYIGQPLCGFHPLFTEIPQTYKIKAPYGVMYMKLDMYTDAPRLWKILDQDKKEWRWTQQKITITTQQK